MPRRKVRAVEENSRTFTPLHNAKRAQLRGNQANKRNQRRSPAPSAPVQLTPEELRQQIRRRKQIRDHVLGHPKANELGGLIAEFHQRNAYSDEAMAGRIIAMYVEFIFGIFTQILDGFVKQGILTRQEAQAGTRLVYQPDENGLLPTIYPLDQNGEPDVTQAALNPAEVDEWLVWKNGYFPKPTLTGAFSMCLADFSAKVLGRQVVDPLNVERLFGEQAQSKNKEALPNPSVIQQPATRPTPATR